MNKKYKRLIYITISICFAYLFIGPHDYDCYKCGASKTKFFPANETTTSRLVFKITGTPCKHDWKVNSAMMGCADCFVRNKMPLTSERITLFAIDSMPSQELKKTILKALTDEKNLLRWAIVALMQKEGFTRQYRVLTYSY